MVINFPFSGCLENISHKWTGFPVCLYALRNAHFSFKRRGKLGSRAECENFPLALYLSILGNAF